MFNVTSIQRLWNKHGALFVVLCVLFVLMAMPHVAHAATDQGGTGLPFEVPLQKLRDSIKGPVAFAISLIGIISAGAVLIFGGEMSGFLRTMVFLVLVIAIITNASNLISTIGGEGALIANDSLLHARNALLSNRGMG
jgi:type IV secretion system protein TrbC